MDRYSHYYATVSWIYVFLLFSKGIVPPGHFSGQNTTVLHSKRMLGNALTTGNGGSEMSKIAELVSHFKLHTGSSKKRICIHQNKCPSKPQKQFNAYTRADNTTS